MIDVDPANATSIDQQLGTLEVKKDEMLKQLRGLDDALAAVRLEESRIHEELDHLERHLATLGRVSDRSEELMQRARDGLRVIDRNYTASTYEAERILACLDGRCGESGDLPQEDSLEALWQEVHARVREARRVEAALEGPDVAAETTPEAPSSTEEGMFEWFEHKVLGVGTEESKTTGSTTASEPSEGTAMSATTTLGDSTTSSFTTSRLAHHHLLNHHGAAGHRRKLAADEPERERTHQQPAPPPQHAPPGEHAQCSSFEGAWDDGRGGTVEITQQADCVGTLTDSTGLVEDVEMIGHFIEFASKPLSGELTKRGDEIVWTDEQDGIEHPAMVYSRMTTVESTSALGSTSRTSTVSDDHEVSTLASTTDITTPVITSEKPAPEHAADVRPGATEPCTEVRYSWKSVRPTGSFCLDRSTPIAALLAKVCEEQLGPYGSYDVAKCFSEPFVRCQGPSSSGRWYSAGGDESAGAVVDEELRGVPGGHFTCENYVRLWGRDT